MPLYPRRKPDTAQAAQRHKEAIDFAWHVHGAQEAWTAKVDTKASILLALQGGALFAILAANAERGVLGTLTGCAAVIEVAGAVSLVIGLLSSAIAVFPLLGPVREHRANFRDHFIYFGHVRHWEPAALAEALRQRSQPDEFDMLALQLIAMSKRNWLKHRFVQVSLLSAILGVALVGSALGMQGALL